MINFVALVRVQIVELQSKLKTFRNDKLNVTTGDPSHLVYFEKDGIFIMLIVKPLHVVVSDKSYYYLCLVKSVYEFDYKN